MGTWRIGQGSRPSASAPRVRRRARGRRALSVEDRVRRPAGGERVPDRGHRASSLLEPGAAMASEPRVLGERKERTTGVDGGPGLGGAAPDADDVDLARPDLGERVLRREANAGSGQAREDEGSVERRVHVLPDQALGRDHLDRDAVPREQVGQPGRQVVAAEVEQDDARPQGGWICEGPPHRRPEIGDQGQVGARDRGAVGAVRIEAGPVPGGTRGAEHGSSGASAVGRPRLWPESEPDVDPQPFDHGSHQILDRTDPALAVGKAFEQVVVPAELGCLLEQRHPEAALGEPCRGLNPGGTATDHDHPPGARRRTDGGASPEALAAGDRSQQAGDRPRLQRPHDTVSSDPSSERCRLHGLPSPCQPPRHRRDASGSWRRCPPLRPRSGSPRPRAASPGARR